MRLACYAQGFEVDGSICLHLYEVKEYSHKTKGVYDSVSPTYQQYSISYNFHFIHLLYKYKVSFILKRMKLQMIKWRLTNE